MMLWMLEDSDSGKDEVSPKGKRKNSTGTGKGMGTGKEGKDGAKSSGRVNTPKIQSQCWNCGKTGHQHKDCWVNLGRWPQQQSQGHSNSPGKGSDAKGKPGKKVVERKENPKMLGRLCGINSRVQWRAQWHCLHQTETSTTVGTVDAIECTALDLCATALTQQEIVNPRWIAFNVDTGAGGTVWPMNADYASEKISSDWRSQLQNCDR